MTEPKNSSNFVGFNLCEEVDEYGYTANGVYINPTEIASIRTFEKKDYGKYSVVTLKSGKEYKVLGDAWYLLAQIFPEKLTYEEYLEGVK